MNPWDIILLVLGWLLLIVVVVVAVAIVLGVVRGLKPKATPSPKLEDYLKEASFIAKDLYGSGNFMYRAELIHAFMAGARWGWGFHRRKSS